jgi:hypothetical protein
MSRAIAVGGNPPMTCCQLGHRNYAVYRDCASVLMLCTRKKIAQGHLMLSTFCPKNFSDRVVLQLYG